MGLFRRTALWGLLAALCIQPAMAQQGGLRVAPVTLMHADMAALRGFIPSGWRADGGLTWGDPCAPYGYNINWTAQSPDGAYGLGFFPSLSWGRGEYSNCQQTPLASLQDLLNYEAQAIWPGARMIDFRPAPIWWADRRCPRTYRGWASACPAFPCAPGSMPARPCSPFPRPTGRTCAAPS